MHRCGRCDRRRHRCFVDAIADIVAAIHLIAAAMPKVDGGLRIAEIRFAHRCDSDAQKSDLSIDDISDGTDEFSDAKTWRVAAQNPRRCRRRAEAKQV
jgi:hypothetical protein